MNEEFRYERSGRQHKSVILTSLAAAALVFAIVVLHIHPVIAVIAAALISPAIWDVLMNTRSELTLSDHDLHWRIAGRGTTIPLHEIERVTTKLSLDFSQKAVVLTKDGKRHRIPPPCIPQNGSLDDALKSRDVAVERSLF